MLNMLRGFKIILIFQTTWSLKPSQLLNMSSTEEPAINSSTEYDRHTEGWNTCMLYSIENLKDFSLLILLNSVFFPT